MRSTAAIAAAIAALASVAAPAAHAQRQMEALGRGVVAVRQPDGKVFVGWRLLGTEAPDLGFHVYRATGGGKPVRLTDRPLTGPTNFVDASADPAKAHAYTVRAVSGGKEQAPGAAFRLPAGAAKPYLSIPLQTPAGYTPNDASAGDLDGDGEYEIVLHQAGKGHDNSHNGVTDPPVLQAYKLDGTLLWTIDLGKNMREGAHYTQFLVYDFDGDGHAEVVCKTADGTRDGKGKVIGDANADYRNESGRILAGPEFLTVFHGKTGAALATTDYVPARHPTNPLRPTGDEMKAVWGDGYGNRGDRFLACVAYLDGKTPSIVLCRGYYTRTVLAAWDWKGGKLASRWVFDSAAPGNEKFGGQGNHNLSVADVDGDGRDEIVYGQMTVDDDGKGLYSTGIGHGDALHVSDLDPTRPGLEVFSIQERFGDAGANFRDARTGEVIWKKASVQAATSGGDKGEGPGRGLSLDIDPRHPGAECWVAGAGLSSKLWDARGNQIADKTPSVNMGVYWDGDPLRELLNGTTIDEWDWENAKSAPLLQAKEFGCASNNGTKANPSLSADLLGDWREEVVWRSEDGKELRVFTTTIPTERRLYTLMHDPVYRLGIAWQNVAYNQPPHLGFALTPGAPIPRPNIALVRPKAGAARQASSR